MFSMLMRPVAAAIVLCVIILLVGNGVASLLKIKKSVASVYFCGLIFSWAVTQLVAIPMILTRQSFTATYWLIVVLVGASFLYGIYACRKLRFAWPKWSVLDWISVGVMTASVLILLYVNLVTQRTDADDSRFVVNAVDILRTDTMFLTNPATGEPLENWQGELIKDVTAPWAVFIALCAKLTGSHVAVMAHTSLPLVLLLGVISVWWMLSETFFKKERFYRCLFVDVLILVTIYGGFSVYTEEVFMLSRIWQGKSVVAAFGVPAAYLIGDWIFRNKGWGYYVLPVLFNPAMCLLSGMGLIIGAMLFASIGLVYGIAKKNWRMSLLFWGSCIPNVIYFLINRSLG